MKRSILALLTGAAFAQDAATQAAIEKMVKMHDAWGPKASSPGLSLQIAESSREGDTIRFRLTAKGAPKGPYSLVAWPVTQKGPVVFLKGVTLNAEGLAVCSGAPGSCNGQKPDDPIDITIKPAPGEPVRIGLVSDDGATKVFQKIVPLPIAGDDQGCKVEATLLTPGAELILLTASGFTPAAELEIASDSEGEAHATKASADQWGHYATALLPYAKGKSKGVIRVTVKSAKCAPSLSAPWGKK